jgi:AcrR family transcriptional regulator
MNNPKKTDNSAIKILQAAEEVFAEKGFDGARVDEIAKRANVNKALIYYYYESKEQILEELSKRHVQEIISSKENLVRELNPEEGLTRENIGKFLQSTIWSLFSKHKDFMSIVMIEALKNKSGKPFIFTLVNQLMDDTISRFKNLGININFNDRLNFDYFKTMAFFYGEIPIVFYMALGERWAEFNGIPKELADSAFIEALSTIEFSLFLDKFNLTLDKKVIEKLYPDKAAEFLEKQKVESEHL